MNCVSSHNTSLKMDHLVRIIYSIMDRGELNENVGLKRCQVGLGMQASNRVLV
jgi:hypothetical protein